MGYVSHAQRKAVHASKADGGKGNPNKKKSPVKFDKKEKNKDKNKTINLVGGKAYASSKKRFDEKTKNRKKHSPVKATNLAEVAEQLEGAVKAHGKQAKVVKKHIKEMKNSPVKAAISGPCKSAAKKKFKVWPSAYASGWGVRCTKAGGPSKMGKGNRNRKK
tara:strand:- start:322 stop:807 length:486 start_codon:yes stop_codon:yes gene_type:complete